MTEEEIYRMSDSDVNTYIGKNVMGWTADGAGDWFNSFGSMMNCAERWIPAWSLDRAIEALDKAMGDQSYAITVGASWEGQTDPFFCFLRKKDGTAIHDVAYAHGTSRSRALCNAILVYLTNK